MTTTQTANPGKYNIGQQARVIKSALTCQLAPYVRLVNQCKDKHGFVTVQAVKVYAGGRADAQIGNMLGSVYVPMEALVF
ncbi:MAG: hypothetical protein WC364_13035 [Eubacteriales bacterium]|jgi:hypothetical protein